MDYRSKRSLALGGLAGGIDYLITGSNLHALSMGAVIYCTAQLCAPHADDLRRKMREWYGEKSSKTGRG